MIKQLRLGGNKIKSAYWSLVGTASAMIFSMQPVMAATIWDRFSAIMQDIYGQIVAISTIVAVTVGAIALIIRMVSRNQRAVDEATQWLKRILDHSQLSRLHRCVFAASHRRRKLLARW